MTALAHTINETVDGHTIDETVDGHTVVDAEESTTLLITELVLPDQGYVTSNMVDYIITLTEAEYLALPVIDPRAFYAITA